MAAKRQSDRPEKRGATAVLAAVTVVVVAIGVLGLINAPWGTSSPSAIAKAATHASSPTAATAAGTESRRRATPSSPATESVAPPGVPLRLLSTTPNGDERPVGTAPIVLRFNESVAADTVMPAISPATPGQWSRPTPTTLRFDPESPFVPGTLVTVTLPRQLRGSNGEYLSRDASLRFHVADGSVLRLQQLLAEMGYLPVEFTPSSGEPMTREAQGAFAFNPPDGTFAMRYSSTPAPLAELWQPGKLSTLTIGAVMAFENVHGLAVDGDPGPAVWGALLDDAVNGETDPQPYTWAWTTMTHPETLRIWSDGEFVFSSAANTGIPAAPTPTGSWPVYARYLSQTMKGTNPDGTKYNDPGVPYINYFHEGDAIHGFKRASYGTEQSLGCVELPYAAAAKVWDLIDYGTIVTVTKSVAK